MQICFGFLNIIRVVVTVILTIVRKIVETACGWVTSIVTTFVEVTKKVCKWLPWPVNKLCDWVTELIEVANEVLKWVCEEVITFVFDVVEAVIIYVFYVLEWVCWVIDWPLRLVDIFFCWLGVKPRRRIHMCVKILTDDARNPATTADVALAITDRADELFDQCNIDLCVDSVEFVTNPDLMTGVECGASQFFSTEYPWFEKTACLTPPGEFSKVFTAFFVDSMAGGTNACAISGSSYVLLTDGANGASLVHELGHQATLGHRDDPENIMFGSQSDTKDKLTGWQCCMIRSSVLASQFSQTCGPRLTLGGRIATIRETYRSSATAEEDAGR